jgi:hypothetical protein
VTPSFSISRAGFVLERPFRVDGILRPPGARVFFRSMAETVGRPKTATGKIQKFKLREKERQGRERRVNEGAVI